MARAINATRIPGDRAHLLAYAVLLPTLVLALGQLFTLGEDPIPRADWAVEELHAHSASELRQFLGMYSRDYEWRHPGPLVFYWFSPFYWLSGRTIAGLTLAAAVLAVLLLGLIIWCAREVWGRRGVWPAAVVVLAYQSRFGVERLRDPWTPYMIILPVAASLVMIPAIARRPTMLKVVVQALLLSFAVQTHIGTAPIVLVVVVGTTVAIWFAAPPRGRGDDHPAPNPWHRDRVEETPERRWRASREWDRGRLVAGGVLTTLVVWLPPLYDQLRNSPGNMVAIYRFFVGADDVDPGGQSLYPVLRRGLRYLVFEPKPVGDEIMFAGPDAGDRSIPWTAVLALGVAVLAIVVLVVVARRRHRWFDLDLIAYVLIAAAALVVGGLRIDGDLWPYLFTGFVGIGLAFWWAVVGEGARLLVEVAEPRLAGLPERSQRSVAVGAVALLGVASIWLAVTIGDTDRELYTSADLVELEPAIAAVCARPERSVLVAAGPWYDALGVGVGLLRCGKRVSFAPGYSIIVGPRYAPRASELDVELVAPGGAHPGHHRARPIGELRADRYVVVRRRLRFPSIVGIDRRRRPGRPGSTVEP